jgi:fatty-acyl-CoA synthase
MNGGTGPMDAQELLPEARSARQQTIGDLLRRSAIRFPDRTALVDGELRLSYASLDERVNRTANALAARGIERGDRVAILARNSATFAVLYLALARLGAVSVPINFMLNAGEVAFVLDHAGVSGVVADRALATVAAEAIASADADPRLTATIGGAFEEWESAEAWFDYDDATEPDVAIGDDDVLQLLYTSGTESRPKGVALTSRTLIAEYVTCIVDGEMTADDIEVHALPMYHSAQLHCFLTPDLYLGATSVILDAPDPERILEAVERERATKLFCPPTVWISLLRSDAFDRRDLSSLRKGYYGAASMPVEVLHELGRRLPDVRLFNFYGQTELAPVATILRPEDQLRKAGSAGRAGLNVETRVVDEDDRPLPAGEVGEIVHRSPHAMRAYWNDREKTAQAFRNGWFHSGDLGVFDDEGYLTIVDRKKDMINTGGENVASREVEEAIYGDARVAEVAVFALPHPRWIETVVAAVVPRAGEKIVPEEVIAHCRQRLAPFKVPKLVVLVDALPKNPSGKIVKRDLRERYSDRAEAIA